VDLKLDSSISLIKGVGKKYLQVFHKNGILTVLDLLLHFPIFYVDFTTPSPVIEAGEKKLYLLEVLQTRLSRIFRSRRKISILRVKARISNREVYLVFFNKPYLEEFFKTAQNVYIYGQFELKDKKWQANTPTVFTDSDLKPVLPVYSKISVIKSGTLRNLVEAALENLPDTYEALPGYSLRKYSFPGIVEALKGIHFPSEYRVEEIDVLKKRFIYGEFLFFQLELQYIRNFFRQVKRVNFYKITREVKKVAARSLDFDLTPDQKRACRDMLKDLEGEYTMQRLLQGDVGSGKTVVAFIALMFARVSGLQGAFLAPTEILAHQHFDNASAFFSPDIHPGARIELLTGSTPARKRKEILAGLREGAIDIVFGTHALLTEDVRFCRLGMVIIDEQHRFGVSQRAALYYKGHAVDLLVTTATPIPRTMLLSLYNDLAVSVIKTKPSGRLPIHTRIIPPERRDHFYKWLRKKIEGGEKAYIILPLIEKSEAFTELRDIETESVYFRDIFEGIGIGIVTGRMSQGEKDTILDDFAAGKIRVLVATTVIEVGIDVRDATLMVIENADRYGLSQLHQLRGRVGRGNAQSYCYLFPSPKITGKGKKRLSTIAASEDGFKIAEIDLKIRGGGIIAGLEQTGYLDFKIGNLRDHMEIYKEVQKDVVVILEDESLQNEFIKGLLQGVREKLKTIHFS